MLDTGADISFIKDNVDLDYEINSSNTISLKGLDANPLEIIKTKGTAALLFQFNPSLTSNSEFSHNFHIVKNCQTNLKYDGILGNDFLVKNNFIIDYSKESIKNKIESTYMFFENKFNRLYLQPRSECLAKISVSDLNNLKTGYIEKFKLFEGIYVSDTMTTVDENGQAYVSIINTTNLHQRFKMNDPKTLHPIPQYMMKLNLTSTQNPNRINHIKQILRTDHLNEEEKQSLFKLCEDFSDIFQLESDYLSCTSTYEHTIPTFKDSQPIHTKSYRYPEVHKHEVNDQIQKLLKTNIIQPSQSPWSSPLWVVPKKLDASGKIKWRVVIDYRKLNDITIRDSYPLPNINHILDQLGSSKYFSTLDLASGFHQIPIKPSDKPKTAFNTPNGHYEFNRMPFGLKNAPAAFQRLMDTVLTGLQGVRCFVYLDDIVIYASSIQDHDQRIREVFKQLQKANLKLQPDKCEFLRREVTYLGHVITNNGVKPNPEKIEIIKDFPTPISNKDIQSFLGLVGYYRRFIPDFTKFSQCLTKLLKKNAKFIWTDQQQNAFDNLRRYLISEPILQYPDFSKPFILKTDASNFAIGAILSQGDIPNDLPISYASRTLNKAESNYSTTERELLAIVWAVKHFRPYLYGKRFKITSDHKPLTWLFNVKDPGSRLIRWRLKLEEYDYEISYVKGCSNQQADCLSRLCQNQNQNQNENTDSNPHLNQTQHQIHLNINDYIRHRNMDEETIVDFQETNENILPIRSDIAYFNSLDFEQLGISKEIIDILSVTDLPKNLSLNHVHTSSYKNHKIYHLLAKEYSWETTTNTNMLSCFDNLKTQLIKDNIKEININMINENTFVHRLDKIKNMLKFIFNNSQIKVNLFLNKIETPNSEQIQIILHEYHDSPNGGHCGTNRMTKRIQLKYKWKNMKKEIKKYVKKCPQCKMNKIERRPIKLPMEITSTSSSSFERIAIDTVGPLPLTESGNKFVLSIQDDLTKFTSFIPMQNHTAETVATNLFNNFISKMGLPKSILTDQGSDFTSNLMKELSKLFRIKKIQTTAYRPESNGALERVHATLAEYLKNFIDQNQTDWDTWLPFASFSYNTTPHSTTKFTPYELVFGNKPEIPSSLNQTPEFHYTYDTYMDNLKYRLQKSNEIARNNIIGSKQTSKASYDKKIKNYVFKVGDKVYLKRERETPGRSCKLSSCYVGPFKITEINSRTNVTIKIKNKTKLIHINRLKPFSLTE